MRPLPHNGVANASAPAETTPDKDRREGSLTVVRAVFVSGDQRIL